MTDVSEVAPTAAASAPRPGWYQDPRSADSVRWWDGSAWSGHVRPKPGTVPATPAPVAPTLAHPAPVAPQPAPVVAQPLPAQTVQPVQPAQPVHPQDVPAIPVPPWAHPSAAPAPVHSPVTPTYGAAAPAYGSYPQNAAAPIPGTAPWGHPSTPAAWGIGAAALGSVVIGTGLSFLMLADRNASVAVQLALGAAVTVVMLVLAVFDRRQLRARGWTDTAHPAWVLLIPPLIYFSVRGSKLRSMGGKSPGPTALVVTGVGLRVLLFGAGVALSALVGAASAAGSGPMYGAFDRNGDPEAGRTPTRADAASFITDTEYVRSRADDVVDCGVGPLRTGDTIECVGQARNGAPDSLGFTITVGSGTHVSYTSHAVDAPVQDGSGATYTRVLSTVATDRIDERGYYTGAAPSSEELQQWAAVNLAATGRSWTTEGCQTLSSDATGANLGCSATDADGTTYHYVVGFGSARQRVELVLVDP